MLCTCFDVAFVLHETLGIVCVVVSRKASKAKCFDQLLPIESRMALASPGGLYPSVATPRQ